MIQSKGGKKDSAIVCAAIDFGTTYSGYAYCFKDRPKDIKANYWPGQMIKTPTSVLVDPDGKFHSFGKEARDKYEDLISRNEHGAWSLFERFKMKLYDQQTPLSVDLEIEDMQGLKCMKAIKVFSMAIKYMVHHLHETLNEKGRSLGIKHDEIHWVITVPAIWSDRAKLFMREASSMAGLRDDMITLALEPEAASLYCKPLLGDEALYVGCRYTVLDIGGGTVDITVHEVNEDGSLNELYHPSGGDFGGIHVDNKFLSILQSIFGKEILNEFRYTYMREYWELMNDFEIKKKMFNGTGKVILKFPIELLDALASRNIDVVEKIKVASLTDKVAFKLGKIYLDEDIGRSLFDDEVTKIKNTTKEILSKIENIQKIIMVGGFSESPYLELVMKECFGNLVTFPKEPSAAVLLGAVMFGQHPRHISTRVCPFTYGIAKLVDFKAYHPETKRVTINGKDYCDDVFNIHIAKGTKVSVDDKKKVRPQKYYRPDHNLTTAVMQVYASNKVDPHFVDDEGCREIGSIVIDMDPSGYMGSKILVKLIFGGY
ncbi:heat shock 70 kDa protein 12A-like isoform X2 [Dreissena polymorpha]|uniref:heat shock 70 kDa protein 12A-like isoform X2 n=1 Tax=Dreissena polymorpha TaxID=45954 RepID=UPI0022641932|nr:heat shock 70 kDa protein 12A-like isoform X2 [Dreissena polymorpha]